MPPNIVRLKGLVPNSGLQKPQETVVQKPPPFRESETRKGSANSSGVEDGRTLAQLRFQNLLENECASVPQGHTWNRGETASDRLLGHLQGPSAETGGSHHEKRC